MLDSFHAMPAVVFKLYTTQIFISIEEFIIEKIGASLFPGQLFISWVNLFIVSGRG